MTVKLAPPRPAFGVAIVGATIAITTLAIGPVAAAPTTMGPPATQVGPTGGKGGATLPPVGPTTGTAKRDDPVDNCPSVQDCIAGDADEDGIPDAWENKLAARFAPELRLAPDSEDWTRPASVEWYLARTHMRFHHVRCSDCQILAHGTGTQQNLSTQRHPLKKSLCRHGGEDLWSTKTNRFFLQPSDNDVHAGADKSEWRVYVHVKNSAVGTHDVQYWFFYAYNDSIGSANHEGDWEHITITTDTAGNFHSAHFAQHEGGTSYTKAQLSFVHGTHPIVYVADGSHASYPTVGNHDIPWVPGLDDHTYAGGPVWKTWENWVNVGERGRAMNGQHFIDYGGKWGEIGSTSVTSGPVGPAHQSAWNSR